MLLQYAVRANAGGREVHFTSPDGEVVTRNLVLEYETGSLAELLQLLEHAKASGHQIAEVGARLWAALNPAGIRELSNALILKATRSGVRTADECVRVALSLPDGDELEALPWETARADPPGVALGADRRFSLVRAPDRAARIEGPRAVPLRVLVVSPASDLQVERELEILRKVDTSAIQIERLGPRVSAEMLRETLHGTPGWDVLHFIGHGVNVLGKGPCVVLEPGMGEGEDELDAMRLANILVGSGVALVVLNSCLGAAPSSSTWVTSMGPHIMSTAGVPFVVAMRYEILDSLSRTFSETLFRELASPQNGGRVDRAVQLAREALHAQANSLEKWRGFFTPVLFQAPDAGPLLAPPRREREAPAPARRAPGIALPSSLVEAFREGRCLPVVGADLEARRPEVDLPRRAGAGKAAAPLVRIVRSLAMKVGYPLEEVDGLCAAGDWGAQRAFVRVCQAFDDRYSLCRRVRDGFEGVDPPQALQDIAGWDVPGYLYAPVDGLLQEALRSQPVSVRVMDVVSREQEGGNSLAGAADRLLVNLRGSVWEQEKRLILTEWDEDELLDAIPDAVPKELKSFVRHPGRTLLFLGLSPRDPLARRVARLMDLSIGSSQGLRYFVANEVPAADQRYWEAFKVEWIHEDPRRVVDALGAAA